MASICCSPPLIWLARRCSIRSNAGNKVNTRVRVARHVAPGGDQQVFLHRQPAEKAPVFGHVAQSGARSTVRGPSPKKYSF
jgi:hypothetical protein